MNRFTTRSMAADSRPGARSMSRAPHTAPPRKPTARELRVATLPDDQQALYWLLHWSDDGLMRHEACEALAVPSRSFGLAADALIEAGLVAIAPGSLPPVYVAVKDGDECQP